MISKLLPGQAMPRKVVTLRDVAERAGVSVATASAAISGRRSGNCRVSVDVAQKIRRTAQELRYRPNLHAKRLSSGFTRTVALVVKCSAWHNMIWPVSAAQGLLHKNDYDDIFLLHDDDLKLESRHLRMCIEARVGGILFFPLVDLAGRDNTAEINDIYQRENIPVVQLGLALPGCQAPSVVTDEANGTYKAVLELAALGHRDIAHLTFPTYASAQKNNPFIHAHRRFVGYQKAMKELGLPLRVLALGEDQWQNDRAFHYMSQMANQLAKSRSCPTAVVVYSDVLAAAALAGFRDAGLRIPQDISIIGIDKSPLSEAVRPSLSLVSFPYQQIGTIGTEMLMQMMNGESVKSVLLPPTIEGRDTIAAPAKR